MKFYGEEVKGPEPVIVAIPREGKDLIFKAKAVLDYEEFETICAVPLPPTITRPGGEQSQDLNDSEYQKKLNDWAIMKSDWMFLKSFEDSEGLEWETVNMSDSDTWKNYKEELKKAKFSDVEIARLVVAVVDACGLNEEKLEEARKRFLAGQEVEQNK